MAACASPNALALREYRLQPRAHGALPRFGRDSLDAEGQPNCLRWGQRPHIVAARQIKDKVREILLDLAPRDRALLNAVFFDERDRDEVCLEFGVDRDYLRVLLHRAKQSSKTEYVKRIGSQASMRASA